jgi:MFS family permease
MNARYRWFVVAILFAFMLLHQADKLLIGPLTTPIIETFGITKSQMGAVFTGALVVGAVLYPVWGYLYDRYARPKLLALASLIWGSTTWLSAIVPTYPLFVATRASTGVDDSSYPGLYCLISDYFGPEVRGKIYGLLQLTAPTGYLLGMVLALTLRGVVGWRGVFLITGSLGVLLAFVIFFAVKERPRGSCEPELAELEEIGVHRLEWDAALDLFRKPSLRLLFAQGFFGVFPWNVITYS